MRRDHPTHHEPPRQPAQEPPPGNAASPEPARSRLRPEQVELLRRRLEQTELTLLAELDEVERVIGPYLHANLSDPREVERLTAGASPSLIELERLVASLDASRRRLGQVRRALRRIENGTYGICLRTRRPISLRRLMEIPHASLCRDALDEADSAPPPPSRPDQQVIPHAP